MKTVGFNHQAAEYSMSFHILLVALFAGGDVPNEFPKPKSTEVSDALFESVKVAWANSSFACDYELTSGSIGGLVHSDLEPLTKEELRQNHPDLTHFEDMDLQTSPTEMYAVSWQGLPSRGVHFRNPDLQLIRKLPTAPPSLTADPSRPGGGVLSNPSFEQLSNTRMQIRYVHDGQRTSVGRVGLTERDPDENCGFPDPMLTPISPFQECSQFGQVNTEFGPSFLTIDEPRKESLTNVDSDRIAVERVWERQWKQQLIRFYSKVIFNHSYTIPVIESIDQKHCLIHDDNTDGELQGFDRVAFMNHVDCGKGIFLAKRVIRARHSSTRPKILLTEWKSTNLGERPPRDEDFVIVVKGNDDTIGFADRTLRRFTPANLNPLGQQAPGTAIEAPPLPPKVLVPRSWPLSLFIWANLIGLPLIAIYLVRRLRRAGQSHP